MHVAPKDSRQKKANSLSIRLTESAVFLRSDVGPSRRHQQQDNIRTSVLRGLLVLDLVKPTKITSIEVELNATTSTAWPEGIGARRIDVTETHNVFNATTTYFRAGKAKDFRRAASIGPGVSYSQQYNHDLYQQGLDDELEEADQWEDLRGRPRRLEPSTVEAARSRTTSRDSSSYFPPSPPASRSVSTSRPSPAQSRVRPNRHASVDSSHFQRIPPQDGLQHEEHAPVTIQQPLPPIPPYSPYPTTASPMTPGSPDFLSPVHLSPVTMSAATSPGYDGAAAPQLPAAQTLEEHRNSLQWSLENSYRNQGSLSRPASFVNSRSPAPSTHEGPSNSSHPSSAHHVSFDPSPSPSAERGRKGSRFSFQAVSNILRDAVRSSSPMNMRSGSVKVDASRERSHGFGVDGDRERSVDPVGSGSVRGRRGRTMERAYTDGHGVHQDMETSVRFEEEGSRVRAAKEKEKEKGGIHVIEKLLKEKDKEKEKEHQHGWKEFKKGTYTYPISFNIPSNAPPTMHCDYGSVTWRLKAIVHRPGAFKPRMATAREVTVITCPTEEDTEDTENIIVERHWEQQLQYLISISGRSFYIGGTVPITLTLMPLAKAKIHRISVFIEEKVEYYTNMRRVARTDPLHRINLLTVKSDSKTLDPILPLESDCPDALRDSPLFALIDPAADDVELSEIASSLMGPGPWSFHQDLKLPNSCDSLRFTNKNRRSNIVVSHMLKVVLRVERGDDLHVDAKTGKRKLFDIVVQTPILILSCRCNPEWSSLPRYTEVFDDSTTITPSCPCQIARNKARAESTGIMATLERATTRHSSDSSSASAAETSPINPNSMWSLRHIRQNESLIESNDLYERLVSGRESESGEAPPAYNIASSLSPAPSRRASGNIGGVTVI
ncbi:hypothetical protein CPC08DRAFT_698073 [Agrocybe pediades]|nr:hypothetical protein CPC08DRAFT_698073 [Agrocybe pediades]